MGEAVQMTIDGVPVKKSRCCKTYRHGKACKNCPVLASLRAISDQDVKRSDVREWKQSEKVDLRRPAYMRVLS